MMDNPAIWSTKDEIRFIKSLATCSSMLSYRELLINYLAGCEKRARWDNMNRNDVINFAMKKLEKIGGSIKTAGIMKLPEGRIASYNIMDVCDAFDTPIGLEEDSV